MDLLAKYQFNIFTQLLHCLILLSFFAFYFLEDCTEISRFGDFLQIPDFQLSDNSPDGVAYVGQPSAIGSTGLKNYLISLVPLERAVLVLTQAAEGSFCNNVTRALALFILNGILPALLEAGGSFANLY